MESRNEEKVIIEVILAPMFIRALQDAGLYTEFMRNLAYGNDAVNPVVPRTWDKFIMAVYPDDYVWDAFVWLETPEGHETWKNFAMYWKEVLHEFLQ
jgi:hypothetical protein